MRNLQSTIPHRPSGFTLVELLVTIAIISTLMGLMLVGISAVRATSRAVQCSSRLHHIGKAAQNAQSDKVIVGAHGWQQTLASFLDLQDVTDLRQLTAKSCF